MRIVVPADGFFVVEEEEACLGVIVGIGIVREVFIVLTRRLLVSSKVESLMLFLGNVEEADESAEDRLPGLEFILLRIICVAAENCGM